MSATKPVVDVQKILVALAAADKLFDLGGKLLSYMKQVEPALDLRPAEAVDEEAERARERGIEEQAEAVREAMSRIEEDETDEGG